MRRELTADEKLGLVEQYINSSLPENTRRSRRYDLLQVVRVLQLPDLGSILDIPGPGLVQLYRDQRLADGLGNSTVRRELTSIHGVFKRAILLGMVSPPNPASSILVKYPRASDIPVNDVLSVEEVRRLLAACEVPIEPSWSASCANRRCLRDRAIIMVALYHGLRVEELVSLTNSKPPDWNRRRAGGFFCRSDDQHVLVIRGKGARERAHPAKRMVLDAVDEMLRYTGRRMGSDSAPLFENCQSFEDKGRVVPITTRNVNRVLADRVKLAGLDAKRITPHSLRATAATKLLNTPGVTLVDVQNFLGHVSITTTQRYTRLTTDLRQSAAAKLKY